MSVLRLIAVSFLVLAQCGSGQTSAYYADGVNGNDVNDGKSAAAAWKSLAKINATTFQPGDTVYLKAGSVWIGQLLPHGSGSKELPIIVTKYGGSKKPRIDGNGIVGSATLHLNNGKFWEINDLEITNSADVAGDRRGVLISASDFGLVEHIILRNLDIHDVKGTVGNDDAAKRTAGIGIETTTDRGAATRFDDIVIENCSIYNIDNTGIYTDNLIFRNTPGGADWIKRRFTNVVIRNNTIHHIAKNAMIIRLFDGGLIEKNVCYETALKTSGNTMFTSGCSGTVFQYNEGYFNRASLQGGDFGDGSMYDADLKSSNIIFQYSYSHDNSHGLFWTCNSQPDSNIICRYNVSQNDKGIIFCVNYPVTSVQIYNNTVFIGQGLSPTIISERNVNTGTRNYTFRNNVIYNLSSNASYDFRTSGYTREFNYNTFYGFHPSGEPEDSNKLVSDPKFVSAGSASTGFGTISGYALQVSSPVINSGVLFPNHPPKDILGNPVPSSGGVDRGAFEYQGSLGIKKNELQQPSEFTLHQNFPNPFNPSSIISFSIPSSQMVILEVFNALGVRIETLVKGYHSAGTYSVSFNAERYPSGIYLYRIDAGGFHGTKRMVLLK
ncbi:MAG: T9SS type A sorting domain-containing protein [Bacteroidota bacterium]